MPWFKNRSLCPALLHEKQIRLPCLVLSASSGCCLSGRCNAKFPAPRQDALPSQPTLLLLPAGNIFKTPCVSAINVLIFQVQLQCHFFFGIFLISQSQEQWLWPLKTLHCFHLSLGQGSHSTLRCGYWKISVFFRRAGSRLTHLWFPRETSNCIVPVCYMKEIPFRYVDLGQIHSGTSIAGLNPGWWSASGVVWQPMNSLKCWLLVTF